MYSHCASLADMIMEITLNKECFPLDSFNTIVSKNNKFFALKAILNISKALLPIKATNGQYVAV